MIGWVIGRCALQKEHKLLKDLVDISKNEPIPAYVPVHLFYRYQSRHSPIRKPVRELIAPGVVFMQAGYSKIQMVRNATVPIGKQDGSYVMERYEKGQRVDGTIDRVQRLRNFEGFVLDSGGEVPYVIPHDAMTQFMVTVDRTNLFVEQMEQEALGRIEASKKTTWRKLADETRDKLNYMLFGKVRD